MRADIGALQKATTMAIKSGPAPIGPLLYIQIAATIPVMPQAIKQAAHKPIKVYKIIICIGNANNYKETLKQNS